MTTDPRKAYASNTVLVVDPDDSQRGTARGLLESLGYRVLDASDAAGAEQIVKLYVGPIRLLLVEVNVGGVSGHTLAERLRSARPELRVLFASHRRLAELAKQGRLEPRQPFVQKPFDRDRLAQQVRDVLSDLC